MSLHANAENITINKHNRYLDSEVSFIDEQENKVYLDQYEGTNILLVFWATWCGTCVSELPSLDNLQKDFRKLPFKIVAVSQDYQGINTVKNYFASHNIRHLQAFHDPRNQLFRELSVSGLPTAFFINKEGKNKLVFRGRIKWHDDEIRRTILSEIGEDLELPKNTYKFASLNRNVLQNNSEQESKIQDSNKNNNLNK